MHLTATCFLMMIHNVVMGWQSIINQPCKRLEALSLESEFLFYNSAIMQAWVNVVFNSLSLRD